MALLTSKRKLSVGIEVESPYARVDSLSGSKYSISISLYYYVSQKAFQSGATNFMQDIFAFQPSVDDGSKNFIKQAYEHIKSLAEFSDAIDVLE
jgi:hypothetical protein